MNTPTKLSTHMFNSYGIDLLETDEHDIRSICDQHHGNNDVMFKELHEYLLKQHDILPPYYRLKRIAELCQEADIHNADTEPLTWQRPMTEKVFIAIIKDSRRDVLNNPKYFCYKLKDYLKLKRLKAKYKEQAIKLCQSTNS